ncbi:membrane-bound PQQ-dependent dehydrogenase, glucose/quinate/shikimate family [Ancylobacter pratisalsi]|uniref:Membrane-bound PQQ-dependent dehydrogenase, glucose/quinate/shikimate family n=1 Tax=Ancylobacter pratisalsi TaxID=1745854 RepID=A0A6P1YR93_9HYPH|nr:membrane-bound PQQ-dependent dehydrogenase, glucose/quinate/shikimate family [Ancylobacter pratisalsi]QIB34573.1 membrane-bound PQQ-dependent dehydrogenase, glucose/quinate/shikimate family [Ancylobacter pratisalsi]
MYRILLSLLIAVVGLFLLIGGAWLAALGGSWFFILLGALICVSALLLLRRHAAGLALYGLTLLCTLAWAVHEVGFDWWALSARGSLLVALGVLLLLPPMVWSLRREGEGRGRYGLPSGVLAASIALAAVIGGYSMLQSPHDQAGAFSDATMTATRNVESTVPDGEWQAYGRTAAGRRYSPLDQITPANVDKLKVAWTYRTGDIRGPNDPTEATYEVTPLMIDNTVYICTPHSLVIALDAVSGKEKWRFDPQLKQTLKQTTQHLTCRGVSYYDGSSALVTAGQTPSPARGPEGTPDAQRVAESAADVTTQAAGVPQNVVTGQAKPGAPNPVVDRKGVAAAGPVDPTCVKRLFAPTSDGRLIALSAETGKICPGFGGDDGTINLWANMPNVTPGSVYATSPPVVTDKLVIVGGTVNDNVATTSPSGVIRAYDVNTGELVWNFDAKNPDATAPISNGETYSENAPNSWSVSSYDPKLGLIYLPMGNQSPDQYGAGRSPSVEKYSSSILALDVNTGKPAWVFQTVHHDLWDMDVPAQPSLVDLTIGGVEVPALVAATKQGEIYVLNRETGEPALPVTEEPAPTGAVKGDTTAPTQPVSTISFKPEPLQEKDMWGATPLDELACRIKFHSLNYEGRYTPPTEKGSIIYPGNFGAFNWGAVAVDPNRQVLFGMPVYLAFTSKMVPRPNADKRVVTKDGEAVFNENFGAPYASEMGAFLSPIGLPCQAPPWGYIAGVNLTNGKTVYKHINGTVRDLSPIPLPFKMGVPGIGGPIITKGGVAFLSGTLDYYVRGYDLKTGAQLWQARLPAGGQATPSTYLGADGRQYLIVVAGGHGSTGTEAGDSIIAYALPNPG